jgi:hypothetical protein
MVDAVMDQINGLLALPPNWDSYGAPRIDPHIGVAAAGLLSRTMKDDTPLPAIVPLSTGGLQIEWHEAGIDLEVEIESPSHFALYGRDRQTGEEWDETVGESGGRLGQILGVLAWRVRESAMRPG